MISRHKPAQGSCSSERSCTRQEHYRIVILVDIKQRDLPGHVLLKEILEAKYPCQVSLLPASSRRAVMAFRPHMVVLMQLLGNTLAEFSRFLNERGVLVVSLPTEGMPIILDDDFADYIAGRFADKPMVDLQFFWCEEMMARALRNGSVLPDQARVVGVPRFDFYHANLRPLRMSREHLLTKYRLDPAAPTITWTTNFSTADQNVEQLELEWSAYNLRVGLLKDVASFVAAERRTCKEIADCVSRWAMEHKETNV